MYAVFETGGKQYKVNEGDVIFIERLEASEGDTVKFDKVLVVSDNDGLKVGAPYVDGAAVNAVVVKNGKGPKIDIFKYKSKKNERKRQGHRQPYSEVKITNIIG